MQEPLLDRRPTRDGTTTWFREILLSLGIQPGPAWPDRFGSVLRHFLSRRGHRPIRTLSLFSGCGGLDIGFHDAGFEIVQMIEVEPRYVVTLRKNIELGHLPESLEEICRDIRDFIPPPSLRVEFVIGGPPCQTFSAAGRRAAGVPGTSDPRGKLFTEYIRILKTLRPKGFLFENVYGITGAQNGQAWRKIQAAFRDAGYMIHWRVLDAGDYGVPQHRERLFVVGLRKGLYLFPRPTHGPDSKGNEPFFTAREAVTGADTSDAVDGLRGRYGHLLKDIPAGLNYSFYTKEMGHPSPIFSWRSKFSDFLYKADPDAPVRTVKAHGGQFTGPFSWLNRPFTIAELKRLQTLADEYVISGTRQLCVEQIGNAVPPQLARVLALSILDQVFQIPLPFSMHYLRPTQKLGFRSRKRLLTAIYANKAATALAESQRFGKPGKRPRSIHKRGTLVRFLSPRFAWSNAPLRDAVKLGLSYHLTRQRWLLRGKLNSQDERSATRRRHQGSIHWRYVIEVRPSEADGWILPTQKVTLYAEGADLRLFTGLWKAFEEIVRRTTGKQDLVQLSGYYQYKAKVGASLSFAPGVRLSPLSKVIRHVVQGVGVAAQMPAARFATLWDVRRRDILELFRSLRRIGYEVRNHNTNPQIRDGEYLIPYAFPTLTFRSVQLHKSLDSNQR